MSCVSVAHRAPFHGHVALGRRRTDWDTARCAMSPDKVSNMSDACGHNTPVFRGHLRACFCLVLIRKHCKQFVNYLAACTVQVSHVHYHPLLLRATREFSQLICLFCLWLLIRRVSRAPASSCRATAGGHHPRRRPVQVDEGRTKTHARRPLTRQCVV